MVGDELDAARRRYPVGARVFGRVASIPVPGRVGVFVDLGPQPPAGFVDVLMLPLDVEQWPPVATVTDFEVLGHRPGGFQVSLWPLEPRFLGPVKYGMTEPAWRESIARHPLGSQTTATVTQVFSSTRNYHVQFGDAWATVEWTNEPPPEGAEIVFTVRRHLHTTRRFLLEPA